MESQSDISFENAPVVELIAELRWTPDGVATSTPTILTLATGSEIDDFFIRFGSEVSHFGFSQSEKVIPVGFPAVLHQMAWRFRHPQSIGTLFQVGPGIFSANALRPYRRWKDFRETVRSGVEALLRTRVANEQGLPFSSVSLRYMNAFSGDLLLQKAPTIFIEDVLGLRIVAPPAIERLVGDRDKINWNATLLFPIGDTEKQLSLTVGDGKVNGEIAAIFDITVSQMTNVSPTADDVMKALSESRDLIHKCFLEISARVHGVMKPVG